MDHNERLLSLIKEETDRYYKRNYVFPDDNHVGMLAEAVKKRALKYGMDISSGDIRAVYLEKKDEITEKVRKESGLNENREKQTVSLTNMCMVIDSEGRVAALDKVSGGYVGTTFPGGHVETGETLSGSVIREVREETGLEISSPLFCGIYHWWKENVHHIILLYRAEEFTGELRSSEEGRVYWIPLDEYRKKDLAYGMEEVLEIVADGSSRECYMELKDGLYAASMF